MESKKFTVNGEAVTLYPAKDRDCPLIVLNTYTGDGDSVVQELNKIGKQDFNLLVVGSLNWDHDMAPWYCPPLSEEDTPCTGGADDYLELLLSEILPEANALIHGKPSYIGIAGYSLAGLFALYALYKCDLFDCAASMSGSLWFPDFKDYVINHEMLKKPSKIYLSLGDKEAKTRHPLLKTVQENTEFIAEHYRQIGINTEFKMNPGNHYKDAAHRSAKGIMAIIKGE